jgi:predicted AlkP superfamily phosphohydrolase/phosphomutase
VNINTWLVQNGYMYLHGQGDKSYTLNDLFDKGQFWVNTDWSKTKAYALGLGQIYINLQGREKQGIVAPGEEYAKLQDELISKLKGLKDPETGDTMIVNVYKRDDIYHGEYIGNAPDLMIGFNDGYRVSWQTTLGGIPKNLVENNMKKWSGDHCSYDVSITSGVFLSNRKINRSNPRIHDIAPTVFKTLGIASLPNLDGKSLF